jgi:two-component system phosphate regulon sensor histidine kinase PhoR
MEQAKITYDQLLSENYELKLQLEEATDTLEAIRTGQVDALIVNTGDNHQVFTLKTADQTYRVFIEKMNEGAVTLNRDGLILYCNSRFAGMVKMPLERVIGLSFKTFIPDTYRPKFTELINKAWQADLKEEVTLHDQSGQEVCCLLSCNTLEMDEGTALSLILTDLTLLKDVESQLKTKNEQLEVARLAAEKLNNELEDTVKERTNELLLSREHFKYLANNIPQMTWTNLPNGEVNYYNQQWHNYTGLSLQKSNTSAWDQFIHPDDLENTLERYNAALQSGEVFQLENRLKNGGDGTYRWHLNRAVPLRNEKGGIVFWVGTATDIEDQKREMEKKDEFIGIASHELKTPLTSLKGYLQLLTNYKKDDLPQIVRQYVAKANISINKLQGLVNDLLDVSKIQAGRLEYQLTPINLSDVIKTCIQDARHIYPENIFLNEDGDQIWVHGNMERLEQVLMNLISNSVKYSQDNKTIAINTSLHDKYVRVSVKDEGIGLSEEQKQKIFERFYRVEDKKFMTSGLGMGLYISAEIIRNHNGKIGVEGELGKGATFYFDLLLIPAN